MIAQYAPYVMSVVLMAAMVIELRSGKIPNWLTLLPFVLFIAVAATTDDRLVLAWQLGFAAVVFAVGLLLFAFVGFGAGAVKLMAGLALFIPVSQALIAVGLFFVALFVIGFVIIQIRRFAADEAHSWHVMRTRTMPISVPLAATGLAVFFLL